MKCLFPVKHIPLNIFPVCKSAVEEQWNTIPNTTLKPNHNDPCLVRRRNWCCYQSEMINNAEKASRFYPFESQAQIRSSKTGPLACPIEPSDNETGLQPQLWVTPVPKPTSHHHSFSPAWRQPSISEGHGIKQKAISVAEPWKATKSQGLEVFHRKPGFPYLQGETRTIKSSKSWTLPFKSGLVKHK